MQKKPLKELIDDLEQELLKLGYTEGSMKFYRNRWKKIIQCEKAKKSCNVGCIISAITAVILIGVVVPLSSHITIWFTRQKDVLDVANKVLHIYTYSVIGFGICMVQQGAFIGMGRTRIPLFASILRVWLMRYLFILATERMLGPYSVFWGNLFSNYAAAFITTILILRTKWVTAIPKKQTEAM